MMHGPAQTEFVQIVTNQGTAKVIARDQGTEIYFVDDAAVQDIRHR